MMSDGQHRDGCFAAADMKLRQTDVNFEQFKGLLKTFLFGAL